MYMFAVPSLFMFGPGCKPVVYLTVVYLTNYGARVQMLLAEREAQLQRVEAQNDLLCEKVKVLTDSLFAKEAKDGLRGSSLVQPVGWNSYGSGTSTQHSCWSDTDSRGDGHHAPYADPTEENVVQVSVVTAQCKALECELSKVRADRDTLTRKLQSATRGVYPTLQSGIGIGIARTSRPASSPADLKCLKASQDGSNPSTFLIEELRIAEECTQKAEQEAAEARSALRDQSKELNDRREQVKALQMDLRVCRPELLHWLLLPPVYFATSVLLPPVYAALLALTHNPSCRLFCSNDSFWRPSRTVVQIMIQAGRNWVTQTYALADM